MITFLHIVCSSVMHYSSEVLVHIYIRGYVIVSFRILLSLRPSFHTSILLTTCIIYATLASHRPVGRSIQCSRSMTSFLDILIAFYWKDAFLLTPWSRVLLEKLIFTQLLKFSASYGTRRFITVFTRARQWSLSWAIYIQITLSHPIFLRAILILSSYLRIGISSGLCPSGKVHFLLSVSFSQWI